MRLWFSNSFLLYLIIFILSGCSAEKTSFPYRHINPRHKAPEIVDIISRGRYWEPVIGKTIDRPIQKGDHFFVIFRDMETLKILRSVSVIIQNRELDLEPTRYITYPFYYPYALLHSSFEVLKDLPAGNSQRGGGEILVVVYSGFLAVGTSVGFIIGLGQGSYELTSDIWDGFTIGSKEMVLGYTDYEYDDQDRLIRISAFLPYRSITNTAIPIYSMDGKSEIAHFLPKDDPELLFETNFIYDKKSNLPKRALYTEHVPKKKTIRISLPIP